MKTLGLDIGTNSIGWGIVDEAAGKNRRLRSVHFS